MFYCEHYEDGLQVLVGSGACVKGINQELITAAIHAMVPGCGHFSQLCVGSTL